MGKISSAVRELLNLKGRDVWSIQPDKTVFEALKILAEKNIGALLVLDDGKLVGIFSERDYTRKVFLLGKSSKETMVEEVMTEEVCFVTPDTNIEECMVLFTNKHIRHLPVMEADQLIGVISIGDVVNKIIREQKFAIGELENYISGYNYTV
ncbi:MAG: CBS domain-containing protein [Candidatus Omnitrophica bacterium]|nr:CBS domain-containing protein [Candidatus Omnitrophota bacterium]